MWWRLTSALAFPIRVVVAKVAWAAEQTLEFIIKKKGGGQAPCAVLIVRWPSSYARDVAPTEIAWPILEGGVLSVRKGATEGSPRGAARTAHSFTAPGEAEWPRERSLQQNIKLAPYQVQLARGRRTPAKSRGSATMTLTQHSTPQPAQRPKPPREREARRQSIQVHAHSIAICSGAAPCRDQEGPGVAQSSQPKAPTPTARPEAEAVPEKGERMAAKHQTDPPNLITTQRLSFAAERAGLVAEPPWIAMPKQIAAQTAHGWSPLREGQGPAREDPTQTPKRIDATTITPAEETQLP